MINEINVKVCLWYSWHKSSTKRSFIRQCFSPSILLGPPDQPLIPARDCRPQVMIN